MKDVVMDGIRDGKVDLPKSQAAAARNLTIKELIFPDFHEKDVFSFVRTELIAYRDLLAKWKIEYKDAPFREEISSSLNDINEILAHDAQYTVEQKRAMLKEPYEEFIHNYTTVDDFYNKIIDNIVTHVEERLNVEGEYIFWNSKADFLFRKHYSGGRPPVAPKNINSDPLVVLVIIITPFSSSLRVGLLMAIENLATAI